MSTTLQQFLLEHQDSLFKSVDLADVREKLDTFITEIAPIRPWHHGKFSDFASGQVIMKMSTAKWRLALLVTLETLLALDLAVQQLRQDDLDHTMWGGSEEGEQLWQQRMNWFVAARELLRRPLPLESDEITLLLLWLNFDEHLFGDVWLPLTQIVKWLVSHFETQTDKITEQQRLLLQQLRLELMSIKSRKQNRLLFEAVDALLDSRPRIQLQPGEAWSDKAIKDIQTMEPESFALWCQLIAHCKRATGAKPTLKWTKQTQWLVEQLGWNKIKAMLLSWFGLVGLPRTEVIEDWGHLVADPNLLLLDEHMDILRGLAWVLGYRSDQQAAQALAQLVLSAYVKVPGVGERAVKVASGGIYALATMPDGGGIQELKQLQQQVSFRTGLKSIAKALAQ